MNDETLTMTRPQCAGEIFKILAEHGISVTSSDKSLRQLAARASNLIAIRARTAKHAVKALEALMTAWDDSDGMTGEVSTEDSWGEEASAVNGAM